MPIKANGHVTLASCCPTRQLTMFTISSLVMLTGLAQASPSVDGMSIDLPDDGWYQVQNSKDYSQVCAGVRSCEVPAAGRYIVINHTTGERFEDVEVIASDDTGSGVMVTGNIISWADNGWYQVQDAQTYVSICEGGRSCEVENGTYIVINHTTGQRSEGVVVDADKGPAGGVIVNEGTISWPDDGWYQVQDAQTYVSVCQGGRSCEPGQGSFHVINLTTGQRWEHVRVDEGQVAPVDKFLSVANAELIFSQVVAVLNEEAIDALYETAQQDLNFQGKTFFISNTIDEIVNIGGGEQKPVYPLENGYASGNFVDATRYAQYSCSSGGTVTLYFAYPINASDSEFDNCVAGSNTYNGTTGIRNLQRGQISEFPFYDFSITDSNGDTRIISGRYAEGNLSYIDLNAQAGWDSASFRGTVEGGKLTIDEYTVLRTNKRNSSHIAAYQRPLEDGTIVNVYNDSEAYSIAGSFRVSAPWSKGQTLQVDVSLSFSDTGTRMLNAETGEPAGIVSDSLEDHYWQTGSVDILAEDGSRLKITPAENERNSFQMTTGSGEVLGPLMWGEQYRIEHSIYDSDV